MKKSICALAVGVFLTISAMNVFAGSFVQDSFGLKYDVGGGRYLEDGWAWCDPAGTGVGYSYYFAPSGYILINTVTPDGHIVDVAGRLTVDGVVMTKIIEPLGYELNTASYLADPRAPQSVSSSLPSIHNATLANRIISSNNAGVTNFSYGLGYYTDAIEFTEGYNPYIVFNSGLNTSLTFDLTGDNLVYQDGDFTIDIFENGVLTHRFSQRFIDLTTRYIKFAPHQNIEIRVSALNDYNEEFIRRVYIINSYFN